MKRVSVYSSRDKMKAFALIPKAYQLEYPSVDEIRDELTRHGVVFGVDIDAIFSMTDIAICEEKIVVATGKPFKRGEAGRLEFMVDLSEVGKPKILPDGRVDHMELRKLINVRAQENLVARIPPIPGENGMSVLGVDVEPPPVEEAKLISGIGTEFSEKDENILVASVDGALIVDKSGRIEVRTARVINGDIDYSTGNVTFSGDVTIRGTVRSGFTVSAEGIIKVDGGVEDATLKSDGDIIIAGGASGKKKGLIAAKGDLKIRHIENFSIKVGGELTVSGSILHSNISVSGGISIGAMLGGKAMLFSNGKISVLGAPSGVKTKIVFGGSRNLIKQKKELDQECSVLSTEIGGKKESVYKFVIENIHESGTLDAENEVFLDVLKEEICEKTVVLKEKELALHHIVEKIAKLPLPEIICDKIYPNTIIRYGDIDKTIKNELQHKTIAVIDGVISI